MAKLPIFRAGFGTWLAKSSRYSPLTARISVVPSAGSLNPVYSCVRATAGPTMLTVRAPPDRLSEGCSSTLTKSTVISLLFDQANCPLSPQMPEGPQGGGSHALDRIPRRLDGSTPAAQWRHPRGGAPSRAAVERKLVVRFRQRGPDRIHPAGSHWHSAGHRLCPLGLRSLEQPSDAQPRSHTGLVPARHARLGFELHGCPGTHPHGPGVPVWSPQVSTGIYLDRGRLPAADDARHGVHRSGPTLRPGRLLGPGHWRRDHGPCPFHRRLARQPAAGWSDHRGRNAFSFLRAPCVCDPGYADRAGGSALADGSQARHQ